MRSPSQAGTRPPWSGRSALPARLAMSPPKGTEEERLARRKPPRQPEMRCRPGHGSRSLMLHHYLPDGLVTPYLISEWVIRIVMLFFVPSRRTPQAAQAWLLLIFFLPIPGLILYA